MITIILAGGLGKRMKMKFPKVLLKVNNIPMIIRTINNAILLKSEMIFVVVNPSTKDLIEKTIKKYVANKNIYYIVQNEPLGTGDAIRSCIPYLEEMDPFTNILILNADMPLLSFYTINTFIRWKHTNDSKILSIKINNPQGYGRIIRDNKYNFVKIIEDSECNEEEKKIKFINTGVYLLQNLQILDNISKLTNNNKQGEYYITELINLIKPDIYMLESKYQKEVVNVNDIETLKKIENDFR